MPPKDLTTLAVHAGEPKPRVGGAISLPVFQSSTYEERAAEAGDYHAVRYMRLSNSPNHLAAQAKIAALEGGEAALVTASGMAAISTALLGVLKRGDHLLAQSGLYGGTHTFMRDVLPQFGIEVDFINVDKPDTWEASHRPNTRALYVESATNPLLEVGDLAAAAAFARRHRLVSLIDNTLLTPVNFRPLELGFDLVLHSATKYLNGHSDIIAGAVVGAESLIQPIKHQLDHLGGALDTHACSLLHRGLKTLTLRMAKQNANALALAEFLAGQPQVAEVYYPGLASHPGHSRARQWFSGFGGLLSFRTAGGAAAAQACIERLTLATHAVSLGGVETLITLPAHSSHAGLNERERTELKIDDALIRVAVGIESVDDLVGDFRQALTGGEAA